MGDFPFLTNKTTITLFGTKSKNASVAININNAGAYEAVTYDCLTTWAADISLSDGANSIEIFSLNRIGGRDPSTPIPISITRDTTAPNAPNVTSCGASTSTSPCTLFGTKAPGESVFINNRLVVEGSSETLWSYDVTLTASGNNAFDVQLQDAAGNKSAKTSVTVSFGGSLATPPTLVFPLGNTGVVNQTPIFRWRDTNSGVTYRIQVSTSPSFSTTTVNDPVLGVTIYTPNTQLPAGRYYWRVGSTNASGTFYTMTRRLIIGQSLCNLNDDGYDDIVVGAYENDSAGTNSGKVYVYYGSSPFNPNNTPNVVLTGEAPGDRFGISVSCAGDVNGDGVSDLIVGAYLNDSAGENAGRAYIFYGGSALTSKSAQDANIILTGQAASDQFGLSVSTAGDVNGDGFDDVIVGAYQNDGGGTNAGRAYIYYGGPNMDNLPDAVLTGEAAGDQFGIRVAWAGDVNGDTYDDIIVGADRSDVGTLIDAGRAYVFFGAPNMAGRNAANANVILEGEGDDDAFASVAGAGDFNNDGYSDIVVGASAHKIPGGETDCFDGIDNDADGKVDRADPDCQPVGRTYVFLGGSGFISDSGSVSLSASSADLKLDGESPGDAFGFAVATAGDVNNDGYTDLLVGAFGKDGTASDGTLVFDVGKAYLYYGRYPLSTGTPLNGATITGQAAVVCSVPELTTCPDEKKVTLSGQFGFSLSGAGDVDGDGNQDIVIGSYLWDEGRVSRDPITNQVKFEGTDKGQVYFFRGPASTFPPNVEILSNTFKLTGDAASDGFGVSVQ